MQARSFEGSFVLLSQESNAQGNYLRGQRGHVYSPCAALPFSSMREKLLSEMLGKFKISKILTEIFCIGNVFWDRGIEEGY